MKTIFVSSTFKDMHYERDIIHEKVMPDLNEYAAVYGESISFCDLRWGVNTGDLENEQGSRKVLSVCLDEIDRCRPYMIVILGERYGWIPDEQLICETIKEKPDFALDELEKSVTALEIEYGALSRKEQLKRTLFYFREFEDANMPDIYKMEDERHAVKLKTLKERIEKLAGGQIRSYTVGWDEGTGSITGLEHFVELVTQDVKGLLTQEWQEYAKLTPFEKDQRTQWNYARQKAEQFSAKESVIEEYEEKLKEGQKLLVLKGAAGSGKSTLMSRFAVKLKEDGYNVLPIFCGSTSMSDDTLDLIKSIVYYIEDYFSLPHFGEENEKSNDVEASEGGDKEAQEGGNNNVRMWADKMAESVAYYEANAGETLVIFIDAADQLFADEARDKLMFIPVNLSEKVRMAVSCVDTFALPSIQDIEQVRPLEAPDKRAVVEGITRFLGRELEACVIDQMIEKEASESPLYLSLLIQRLVMMNKSDFDDITAHGDGMSAITAHQLELVAEASDTLHGVCVDIVNTAASRIGGMLAKTAVLYIAVSRHGLREKDLETLLMEEGILWNSLDFSLFVKYMRSFFIIRDDGRYDFAHKSIREGFLAECDDKQQLHRNILRYLEGLDSHDGVRVQEIMYHCCNADDKRYLVRYVNEYESQDMIIDPAAKDIYEFSMRDNGALMCAILAGGERYDVGHEFLRFVNIDLDWVFGVSQKELEIEEKIVTSAVSLAKRLEEEQNTMQARKDVITCCYTLGEIYEIYDSEEYRERARKMYEEALAVREQMNEEEQTIASRARLAFACTYVGDIYVSDGSRSSLNKALEMYERALKIREELVREDPTIARKGKVASALLDLGDVYKNLGSVEDLKKAQDLYERALEIRKGLAEEADTRANQGKLANTYSGLAWIYEQYRNREDLDKARELCEKVLKIRMRTAAEEKSISSRQKLASAYQGLGDVFDTYRTREYLEKGLKMYEESLKIREQLAKELGTAGSMEALANNYLRIGGMYEQFADRANMEKAQQLYQKALEIQKNIAKKQKTADSMVIVSVIYTVLGNIYKWFGKTEDLKIALNMYQKAMDIQEQVIAMQQTTESRERLVGTLIEIGVAYEELSGKENLELAAEMFEKALVMQSQLAEELKTAYSRHVLATAYYRAGEGFLQLGGGKNLERAIDSCMKAVEIWELLVEEQGTIESKGRLIFGYDRAASVFCQFKDGVHLKKAIALYQKELSICKELVEAEAVQGRNKYASVCHDLAMVYCGLDGQSNLKRSLELFQEACVLREQLVGEQNDAVELERLARSYEGMAQVYIFLKDNLSVAEKLMKQSLDIREKLARELHTVRSKGNLITAYTGMGNLYRNSGDVKQLDCARQMYQKALDLSRELEGELSTSAGSRQVAFCCQNLGDIYQELGGEQNIRRALELNEEALSIQEKLVSELGTLESRIELVRYIEGIGSVYKEFGGKADLHRALEFYQRSRALMEEIVREDDTAKHRGWLAGICQNIGDIYCRLEGKENYSLALEMYEKVLELNIGIEKELGTVNSRECLAYAYETTGNIYRKMGGRENLDKALELYVQNKMLCERLADETGTADNQRRLAVAYEKIADIYVAYRDREYLEKALSLFQNEAVIWESLMDKMSRLEVLRGLAISHQKTADIYKAYGENEADEQALSLYDKTLGFWHQLYEASGMTKDLRDIAICYERMGDIYGRNDADLPKSLEYYEKAVEIEEHFAKEMDTIDAWTILAIACTKSANISRQLGGSEDIQRAASRYARAVEIREQLVEEVDTGSMRRSLEEVCRKLGHLYLTLPGEEYAGKALEIYRKALSITEKGISEIEALQQGEQADTLSENLSDELYIYRVRSLMNYANIGDVYWERSQDAMAALEMYEKSYHISEILMEQEPDADNQSYCVTCLVKMGRVYASMDDGNSMEESLEIYKRSLQLLESLIREQSTWQNWDNYIVILYNLIRHRCVSVPEKLEYAEQMLTSSKQLYEQTESPRHKNFVDVAEGLLKIINGEE